MGNFGVQQKKQPRKHWYRKEERERKWIHVRKSGFYQQGNIFYQCLLAQTKKKFILSNCSTTTNSSSREGLFGERDEIPANFGQKKRKVPHDWVQEPNPGGSPQLAEAAYPGSHPNYRFRFDTQYWHCPARISYPCSHAHYQTGRWCHCPSRISYPGSHAYLRPSRISYPWSHANRQAS